MDVVVDTLDALLRERATTRPDHPVLRIDDTWLTYGELEERSSRTGTLFTRLGVGQDAPAAVMLDNEPAHVDAWLGLARLGALEVPVHTAYRGDLLHHVLAQSRASVLVVGSQHLDRLAAVADRLPDLRHVLVVTGDGGRAREHGPVVGAASVHDWHGAVAATAPQEIPPHTQPTDRSVVLYTSGTTGPSKGVVLTHRANFRLARTVGRAAGFRPGEVLYTAFPLFHVAARYVSVLAAMLVDGAVVVDRRFSASTFWETCADEGVTAIHYLGSLLTMLLKQPEGPRDRSHAIRLAYGAGAPLPVWEEVERRFGLRLFELYGMTETGAVTMNRDGAYRPGSCGTVLPDCRVEVHDEHDRPVPAGTEGEIVVRPEEPNIMIEEYLGMPEATVDAFRNLWFHTGDRGRFDEDGFLWFSGRQKDAIRRRGENVSAHEVEAVLVDHPDVGACAVIGVEDEVSGEEVMVVLEPRVAGKRVDPAGLLDHGQARLPHFAVPRYVRQVSALPMNTSQRVEKYRLRLEGVTADTWDREAAGYRVAR
jgi:crotonobetaine/carnitine-CoA ligase